MVPPSELMRKSSIFLSILSDIHGPKPIPEPGPNFENVGPIRTSRLPLVLVF